MKKLTNLTLKLILTSIIAVTFMIILSHKSYATTGIVTEGTPTESTLNNISSTIKLDMKTTKLSELEGIIFNQVSNQLKEQEIIISTTEEGNGNSTFLEVSLDTSNLENNLYINKARVYLGAYSKIISIEWENKTKYSETDKSYIENSLKNIGFTKSKNDNYDYEKKVTVYHEIGKSIDDLSVGTFDLSKQLKDTSITIIEESGSGDGFDGLYGYSDIDFKIFKDGVFYARVNVTQLNLAQLIVPNNIEDTETAYINYALPKLREYLKDSLEFQTVTLEKLSGYWYNVVLDGDKYEWGTIIKKADGTPVGNNIYVDNLSEGKNITVKTVDKDTTMVSKVENAGYNKVIGSYEFTLTGATSLNGNIDITFNLGTEYNNKQIYILHQKKDGTFENWTKTATSGKVTITVSELSPFMLAIKETTADNKDTSNSGNTGTSTDPADKKTDTSDTTTKPVTSPTTTTTNKEKDDTPKTGITATADIIGYVIVVTVLAGAGIVRFKTKNK